MADIDPALKRAKKAVEKDLLNRPGVTGVDIGFKEVGGKRTEQLAIRVLVRKKRDVRPEERLPKTIEGFPTDVIERRYQRRCWPSMSNSWRKPTPTNMSR